MKAMVVYDSKWGNTQKIAEAIASAKLPYQEQPALVQVVLIHEGGMASGGANGHGDGVVKAVTQFVDQIALRIRRANQ